MYVEEEGQTPGLARVGEILNDYSNSAPPPLTPPSTLIDKN